MSKVKLGDVAIESRETYRGDKSGLPIVGLEHITPEEVTLSNWATDTENTFTKMFRKGDILFGRRRAYLKKAAQAPFDGICSGDITVIRAKADKLLPDLLPFIIQNDDLFDFAVGKSAGSLSPRVKWENLKNYAFELPSLDEQKKLAEVLWSINDTIQAYQNLLVETDELVKSQFVEMFGDAEKNDFQWEYVHLGEISFITKLAGFEYTKHIHYQDSGDIIMIRGLNCKGTKLILDDIKWIDKETSDQLPRSKLSAGDIVITYVGTVGEIALIDKDDKYHLAPNVAKLSLHDKHRDNPAFWAYMLMISRDYLVRFATSTTQAALNMDKIRKIGFIRPPVDKQNIFVNFLYETDKSKFALQSAITSLQATKRSIIDEAFGIRRKE